MIDTSVTIFGNLTRDPNLTMNDGVARCNFRVASTERRWDRASNAWVDGHSVFISVTCWRSLAENAAGSLRKGDPVVVVGRLRQRSYVNDQNATVNVTEIDGDVVSVDLRRGLTSRLRKVARQAEADNAFDVSRPEDADVRPEDAMAGLDGGAVSERAECPGPRRAPARGRCRRGAVLTAPPRAAPGGAARAPGRGP